MNETLISSSAGIIITTGSVTDFNLNVSRSAAKQGFGSGGGEGGGDITAVIAGSGLGGGALGAAGLYEPMKGVLGTDSGFADFIKKG